MMLTVVVVVVVVKMTVVVAMMAMEMVTVVVQSPPPPKPQTIFPPMTYAFQSITLPLAVPLPAKKPFERTGPLS